MEASSRAVAPATVKPSCTLIEDGLTLLSISSFSLILALLAICGQQVLLHILLKTGGAIPNNVKILFANATIGWSTRLVIFIKLIRLCLTSQVTCMCFYCLLKIEIIP